MVEARFKLNKGKVGEGRKVPLVAVLFFEKRSTCIFSKTIFLAPIKLGAPQWATTAL